MKLDTQKTPIPSSHFKLYQKIYAYLHEGLAVPTSELYLGKFHKKILKNYADQVHLSKEHDSNFHLKKIATEKASTTSTPSNKFEDVIHSLRENVKTCTACDLYKEKKGKVSFGNKKSKIMIITDIPSYYDRLSGRHFSDKVGELMKKVIQSLTLNLDELYITSAVKCTSAKELPNNLADTLKCYRFIEKEIENLSPKFIIAFGESTYKMMHGGNSSEQWRGMAKQQEIPILFTHHPRDLMFGQVFKKEAWDDLKQCIPLIKEITGG